MFNAARTVAFVECVVEVPLTDDPPVTFAPPRQVCDHGRTFSEECDYCEKELVFKRGPIP